MHDVLVHLERYKFISSTPMCFSFPFSQGDVLRNNLLVRYFGKSFIQKPENVEIGVSHTAPVTHGPGGINKKRYYFC